jgi:hypothetical protein
LALWQKEVKERYGWIIRHDKLWNFGDYKKVKTMLICLKSLCNMYRILTD